MANRKNTYLEGLGGLVTIVVDMWKVVLEGGCQQEQDNLASWLVQCGRFRVLFKSQSEQSYDKKTMAICSPLL